MWAIVKLSYAPGSTAIRFGLMDDRHIFDKQDKNDQNDGRYSLLQVATILLFETVNGA